MSNMTLRGLDEKTAAALKDKARQEGTSVNTLTLHLLRQSLGLEKRRRSTLHTDLDHLAGTWNASDAGRLSKEHARSLSTLHEGFARNLTHTLGAYVRVEFAVDGIGGTMHFRRFSGGCAGVDS